MSNIHPSGYADIKDIWLDGSFIENKWYISYYYSTCMNIFIPSRYKKKFKSNGLFYKYFTMHVIHV